MQYYKIESISFLPKMAEEIINYIGELEGFVLLHDTPEYAKYLATAAAERRVIILEYKEHPKYFLDATAQKRLLVHEYIKTSPQFYRECCGNYKKINAAAILKMIDELPRDSKIRQMNNYCRAIISLFAKYAARYNISWHISGATETELTPLVDDYITLKAASNTTIVVLAEYAMDFNLHRIIYGRTKVIHCDRIDRCDHPDVAIIGNKHVFVYVDTESTRPISIERWTLYGRTA